MEERSFLGEVEVVKRMHFPCGRVTSGRKEVSSV